jgi:hypothetical protein
MFTFKTRGWVVLMVGWLIAAGLLAGCGGGGEGETTSERTYGEENFSVIVGVATDGSGRMLLDGYSAFVDNRNQAMSPGAVMVVAVDEVTLNNQTFNQYDILIFDEEGVPRIAPPGTRLILNSPLTILDRPYEAGEYVVSDGSTIEPAG